jgi:acetyl-CoA acetyltransferase family protein
MQNNPVLIDIVRSPMARGKQGGVLANTHPADLVSQTIVGLLRRNKFDAGSVDDVIIGCVSQAGEQAVPLGRTAWLAAGLPQHLPSTTVERRCGSSQQAIHFAAQGIVAGVYDIAIAGGVESMSRVPMGAARMGAEPHGAAFNSRFPNGLVGQGISAELVAARWQIGREEMDEYSVRSHQLAEAARKSGRFDEEIVLRELSADPERLNPRGGAIALGHPLGASGVRLMCSLVNGLEQSGGRFGLQTMCEAGGQANATIIERI